MASFQAPSGPVAVAPTHLPHAERAVLGAILLDGHVLDQLVEHLRPLDFYEPVNAVIYGSMVDLHLAGHPIDLLTLSAELEQAGSLARVGGDAYLAGLLNETPTSAHAGEYARIVESVAFYRGVTTLAGTIAAIAREERDPDAAMARIESAVQTLRSSRQRGRMSSRTHVLRHRS